MKFRKGDEVVICPLLSGPAAGRSGFISGKQIEGHHEVLDQKPGRSDAKVIGYFEPGDLHHQTGRRMRETQA